MNDLYLDASRQNLPSSGVMSDRSFVLKPRLSPNYLTRSHANDCCNSVTVLLA